MNNPNIQLNFLALDNQNFNFKVYRKKYISDTQRDGCRRRKLPITPGDTKFIEYWVSNEPIDEHELFDCVGEDNHFLTLDLIWDTLVKQVKNNYIHEEYRIEESSFRSKIFFVLCSHREGNEEISLEPFYLKSEKKFGFLVEFHFKVSEGVNYSQRIQQLRLMLDRNNRANLNYYIEKYQKIQTFLKEFGPKLFPLIIDYVEYGIQNSLYSMNPNLLNTKTYLFENENPSKSQYKGLIEHGPYSTTDAEPLFVFVFQQSHRDAANEVYRALIGKSYDSHFPGIENTFKVKLKKENIERIDIVSFQKKDLEQVESKLQQILINNPNKKIIGIFIEHSKQYDLEKEFSAYHYIKYIFTKNYIPVQAITIERINGREGLKWSASNLALGLFAKLGGIPWKVKPSQEKCLIFGIGSAHFENAIGKIERYFAYSVCLDSSGVYKNINILGDSTDREHYIRQLEQNIQTAVLENISEGIKKCAIHIPFKIKRFEMERIKNSVYALSDHLNEIDFQFIKINTKNRYFGFAENNSKVPYESSYLQLAANEYLVWFEGLQYGKELIQKRYGNPVHIEFLPSSKPLSQEERKRYLQDIINLSGANWRGFNAKLSPISIYYPGIIAEYLAAFRKFDPKIDISNISIPWFL